MTGLGVVLSALSAIIIVVPDPNGGAGTSAPADQAAPESGSSAPRAPGNGSLRSVPVRAGNGDTVKVTDAGSLSQALSGAKPGQTIELADGTYTGRFVANVAGQEDGPITLKGSRKAVLDGGSGAGYTLHLDGADHWQLVGFSVTGGQKGVMADRTNHTVLSGLSVGNTEMEAVHFLNFSSDNVVQDSLIHNTGTKSPEFGEGVYFGTAKSNWGKKSGGKPDRSNNNKALNNTFKSITAENIDVKEETSGGLIAGNKFDGSAVSGKNYADSVLDVKGTNYEITNNTTSGSSTNLVDGFQTHVITGTEASGCNNTFSDNVFVGMTFNGGKEVSVDQKCGGAKDSGAPKQFVKPES
ncbi:hypothetical protein GCM10023321_55510 [Pseudonocardia eucalypti]|uniref:Uncharacterized protein n=1 Tax=Pseudonocardia eucalypti TaxID=648755 RepID=A0ABP9QQ06_9PSEU|nr:hypothetical protein [Pseudonocardia eucalypti]